MDVWPFIPQRGVTESLEWLTDVVRCKAGEARTSLRLGPRQGFQFTSQLTPAEYAAARVFSRKQAGEFELPLWPHLVNVGDLAIGLDLIPGTFDPDLYLGPILVWEHSRKWERHEVLDVTSGLTLAGVLGNNYSNALVVPLQTATLAQSIDFRNTNGDLWLADLRSRSVAARELTLTTAPAKHRGVDVLLDPNITVRRPTEQHHRETLDVDSRTGQVTPVPKYSEATTKSVMSWHPIDRAELLAVLQWVHSRRGRRHAFWYLSHNRDFTAQGPLEANGPGTDRLVVTTVLGLQAPFDIAILRTTGALRYYRVQSVETVSSSLQRLILTGNAGEAWPAVEIAQVSFMVGSRFDADRIEIKHTHGGAATISVPIIEVPGL